MSNVYLEIMLRSRSLSLREQHQILLFCISQKQYLVGNMRVIADGRFLKPIKTQSNLSNLILGKVETNIL